MNREFELDFFKTFLEITIKEKCDIEGTLIHYTKDSIKLLNNKDKEPAKTK